ncbi:amino acid permease [Candidatus Woesearchaeota archaeon]|nr:amino acid permease [Candidatus Woesearchaeota archaeon]MBW3005248.1 amino acid permease [Candidatus Woesearchaeota archaeon]
MFKRGRTRKEYKGFFKKHNLWVASAILMGTIVGAGVLGIPYAIAKSGLLIGIIHLLVLGITILILHLCIGEISLRTKGIHQLSGYMEKYLGKPGKYFMILSMIIGIYGALIAYILGQGEIFSKILGGSPLIYSFIFFLIASIILYHGIKATGRFELAITVLMVLTIFLIGALAYDKINPAYLTGVHLTDFFMPYGVILFAFVGAAAIPELREELAKDKHKLKKAIIIGSITPIILYFIFALVVLGIVGLNNFNTVGANERIATVALSIFSEPYMAFIANMFAALAMFTSFLGLGLALKEMYMYDCKFHKHTAFLLTIIPPLLVSLLGLTSFIAVIAFAGAVAGGIDGILIMLAYWKAKKNGERKPEYSLNISKTLTTLLIIMFSFGILYQLWSTFF